MLSGRCRSAPASVRLLSTELGSPLRELDTDRATLQTGTRTGTSPRNLADFGFVVLGEGCRCIQPICAEFRQLRVRFLSGAPPGRGDQRVLILTADNVGTSDPIRGAGPGDKPGVIGSLLAAMACSHQASTGPFMMVQSLPSSSTKTCMLGRVGRVAHQVMPMGPVCTNLGDAARLTH